MCAVARVEDEEVPGVESIGCCKAGLRGSGMGVRVYCSFVLCMMKSCI